MVRVPRLRPPHRLFTWGAVLFAGIVLVVAFDVSRSPIAWLSLVGAAAVTVLGYRLNLDLDVSMSVEDHSTVAADQVDEPVGDVADAHT